MTSRNIFGNVYMQKSVAGFVACLLLMLTLFLTFPVTDIPVPVISDADAGWKHETKVEVCVLFVCISYTKTEYHNHTT